MSPSVEAILSSKASKSDKIRALSAAGHSRADIARAIGIRYQFVRNVLVEDERSGRDKGTPKAAQNATAPPQGPAPVAAEPAIPGAPVKLVVGQNGEVVLPAGLRAALGIGPGSVLVARVEGPEIRLYTYQEAIRRARDLVRQVVPGDVSLVDELIADRRREVARDRPADGE